MNEITVRNVCFSYENNREILKDISFSASAHESIGLVGANGVGKSTLLKLLVGLNMNYEGQILIEDVPVNKNNLPEIRQKTGYVFQDSDSQLFMPTAGEDIAFGPRNYGYDSEEVKRRVDFALQSVQAEYLKDRPIYKMSGGEKKLISIATILSLMPNIILMDEPSIALDPKNRRNLIRLLNSFDQCKIIASHDLDLVMDTCSRTILMADGKIIKDGPTSEILTDEKLLEDNHLELPLSLYRK